MSYLIKEMPNNERPRERLVNNGVKSLSSSELLAIILQTGNKGESVLDLSKRILYKIEKPSLLLNMNVEELMKIKGIGVAKGCQIIAAIEFTRRLYEDLDEKKACIYDVSDVYYLFNRELDVLEQEHFFVIYLDMKNQILSKKLLFVGTLNSSLISPRDIFKHAMRFNAASLIFVHNHPSGDPSPSKNDILTTEKLIEAAKTIGIHVIDHVVIGKRTCYSILTNKRYNF